RFTNRHGVTPRVVARVRARFSGRSEALASEASTAEALDGEFARDPGFREEIRVLWGRASGDSVVNSFSGQAKTVVQARDIHGGFTVN
ncbi:hypothetical protein AB0C13_35170, partial [Streptomyces sp. NPDC049099]|uniref:hypothetical protein n=1 Tax=Streptomyces sp. NPDC049099 TaxID=3155768 RepID=UPI00343240D2